MKRIYGLPVLPKAGLANMLIPWAECFLWCQDQGIKQVAPFWRKFRLGPYLRGERDKRQYHRLFIDKGKISGLKRIILLLTAKQIPFENYRLLGKTKQISKTTLVCFSDMNHLGRLIGRHEQVLNELFCITRPQYWPIGIPKNYIGIHIRMGDFPQKSDSGSQIYFRQPLTWYIEALKQLRSSLNSNLTAIIFSDGSISELQTILNIENVIRSPFNTSITDLLAIAKSTVIITSRSSFSLFGAYLGQVPSVWYQGKKAICGSGYMPADQSSILEIEWMPGQMFTAEFIDALKNKIT